MCSEDNYFHGLKAFVLDLKLAKNVVSPIQFLSTGIDLAVQWRKWKLKKIEFCSSCSYCAASAPGLNFIELKYIE